MLFRKFFIRFKSPRRVYSASGSLLFSLGCAAGLSTFIAACLSGPGRADDPRPGEGVAVELQVFPAALAKVAAGAAARPTDSAHVRVSGAGMDTLAFGFGSAATSLSLLDLPPGTSRLFEVRLFSNGVLLYSGAAMADLHTDRKNTVSIQCLPEFSRLSASVHIPIDFPKAVAGGELKMWNGAHTLTAAQSVNGELRNFRLEEVPGNRDYAVSIALWDAAGDTIAKAFRANLHVPKGQNVALVLPLTLTFSQLALAMTVADPRTTSVVLTLPGGRRAPSSFGEAVFSELYPVPTTEEGGDNGEWLELFNRAADTLDLSGCSIIRDAGSSANMNFALPAGTVIPPGRGLVLGKSAVSFAHVTVGSSALSLTNTSARLEFACVAGSVRIDTVRYSTSASDSLAARIASAKVSGLKPSRLVSRTGADAWCLALLNPLAGEFAATPGGMDGTCGE